MREEFIIQATVFLQSQLAAQPEIGIILEGCVNGSRQSSGPDKRKQRLHQF